MTDPIELQQRFYEQLLASQFWQFEEIARHQRGQLEQLLRHARAEAPFYAKRLDAVFRPDGSVDWSRWFELPVVRRADLRDRRDDLLARNLPAGHGTASTRTTSGSSGMPIAISTDQLTHLATGANRWRAFSWHGLDWSKTMCGFTGTEPDPARHGAIREGGSWGPPWEPRSLYGRYVTIDRYTPLPRILDFLRDRDAPYLACSPKFALALALEAERLGRQIAIEAILIHGANSGPLERDTLQRVFGARTIELYSSQEAGQIAHACPDGAAMHVNAETVLVEILDEAGRPCPKGVRGRVVVTPLFNFAQPLIRYDQGDVAEFTECSCGRQLPTIDALIGRVTAVFFGPDGQARSGQLPASNREVLDCREWQVAQTGPLDFEIRYVPRDPARHGDEGAAAASFRAAFFAEARVTFRRLPEIPLSSAGKLIEYVNEFRAV